MKKALIIAILSMCLDIYSQTNYNRVYYFNIIELINTEKKIDSVLITQKLRKTNEENTDFANYNTVFRQNTWKFYLNKWGKLDTFREIRFN